MKKKLLFLSLMVAALFNTASAMEPTIIKPKIDIFNRLPSEIVSYVICNFLTAKELFQILFLNKNCYELFFKNLKTQKLLTFGRDGFNCLKKDPESVKKNVKEFTRIKIFYAGTNFNSSELLFDMFKNIESIIVWNSKKLDFTGLDSNIKKIEFVRLNLDGFSFEKFKNLESVKIRNCQNINLENLNSNIKEIEFCQECLTGFSFEKFKDLGSVTIIDCERINLVGLNSGIKKIKFKISRLFNKSDLDGFSFKKFKNLESVKIENCRRINLNELNPKIKSIGFLYFDLNRFSFKEFKNLESVEIINCENTNLGGMNHHNIKTIEFAQLNLGGFSFKEFKKLKSVKLSGCEQISKEEIDILTKMKIEFKIKDYLDDPIIFIS